MKVEVNIMGYDSVFIYETKEQSVEAFKKCFANHKKNIVKAFDKYGESLSDLLNVNSDEIRELVLVHDNSKMIHQDEFEGYVAHFYPAKDDGIPIQSYGLRRSIYEKALLSHFHNNPHHPEYWVMIKNNTLTPTPMENKYIVEMILDWVTYQNINGLSTKEFWKKDRSKKFIHPDTIKLIDLCIDSLDDDDSDLELL